MMWGAYGEPQEENNHEYVGRQAQMGLQPLIVDAGANIGASAVYFVIAYPNACVVALEPDVGNFGLLSKNTADLNVEALNAAISSTRGRARVFDPGEGAWGYRTKLISEDEIFDRRSTPRHNQMTSTTPILPGFFPLSSRSTLKAPSLTCSLEVRNGSNTTPLIIIELHDWLLPKSGTSRPFPGMYLQTRSRLQFQIGQEIFSIANDLGRH